MNWDAYFLSMARTASTNSKCMSRQIGALLVRGKSIICTAFNGPAAGVPHCDERHLRGDNELHAKYETIRSLHPLSDEAKMLEASFSRVSPVNVCPRRILGYASGEGMQLCTAAHAEANLIFTAAKLGIQTDGCSVYLSCELMPCKDCLCTLIQAGIKEVVVAKMNPYDQTSLFILQHSGVRIREYEL
jgi:dCMP deaminase